MKRILVLLALALFIPSAASAAVDKNTNDSGTAFSCTSFGAAVETYTYSGYTIGAGTNRVLVVTQHLANVLAADITGTPTMSWHSVAMNRVGSGIFNGVRTEIFYLLNPDVGNFDIVANWTVTHDTCFGIISLVDAGTPIDSTTTTGTGTSSDITVTSDANGASLAATTATANLSNPPATSIFQDNGNFAASGASYTIGGTSNNYVWSGNGTWSAIGIHIPQAAAAGGAVKRLMSGFFN